MNSIAIRTSYDPVEIIRVIRSRHPAWFNIASGFVTLMVFCLIMMLIDERLINGVSVWLKPFKFALSITVFFATLVWFAPLMPKNYFSTWRGKLLTWMAIVCALFEIIYITYQGALGQASHFNISTPFHATMYSLMGVAAAVLVGSCLWMGSSILWKHRFKDPYILAVGLGLILTFLLGGGFGGYLGSQTSHWIGGTMTDANGLWLVQWSRDGGDLRVAHFFGMHAMQILPLLALPLAGRRNPLAFISVIVLACSFSVFTIFTFIQALRGIPFLPFLG